MKKKWTVFHTIRCRQRFANNWTKSGKCVQTYTQRINFISFLSGYIVMHCRRKWSSLVHNLLGFYCYCFSTLNESFPHVKKKLHAIRGNSNCSFLIKVHLFPFGNEFSKCYIGIGSVCWWTLCIKKIIHFHWNIL